MTAVQVWEFVQAGGVPAVLVIIIWAGLTKRIRFGYQFDELHAERERERAEMRQEIGYWRDRAWSFSRIAEQVAGALPPKQDQA